MNNQISWKETPPTLHCNSSPIHSSPVLFSKRIINPIHYNTIKSSNVINPSHTSGRDTIDSISTSFINTANTSGRDKDQANPLVCRFLVLEVSLSNHSYSLLALNSTTNAPTTISISGQAALSTIHQGHYIHIIYNDSDTILSFSTKNHFIVNDDLGLLIVLPDILVSCTTASDTTCVRRSILKDKIKYYSPTTKAMIHGNIIHSLFQKAISASNLSKLDLEIMLKQLITDSISDLYSIGGDEQSTFIELVPHLPKILDWLRLNLVHSPLQSISTQKIQSRNTNQINSKTYKTLNPSTNIKYKIKNVLEIEQRIYSTTYGLKGFIDATIESVDTYSNTSIMPLELKTGKNKHISHQAQTTLYNLMLSDHLEEKIDTGLLVYLYHGETESVGLGLNEYRGILIHRNLVAHFMDGDNVPEINYSSACSRCFINSECLIYHKAIEDGTGETSGMPALFNEKTDHLTPKYIEFIKKWSKLISIEHKKSQKTTKDIWTLPIQVREKMGNCLSGLKIVSSRNLQDEKSISKYEYKLQKSQIGGQTISFQETQFQEGDPILVTSNLSKHPITIGFIQIIHHSHIIITTDKPIPETIAYENTRLFNIEKDGFASGMGYILGNIIQMFIPNNLSRLKELVVDLKSPRFGDDQSHWLKPLLPHLNADQKKALDKVTACQDYCLILGMPGTGKTTTIVHIIQMLLSQGKSILLTSYTHSAVDNVLLKLLHLGIDFLRLGPTRKFHPQIKSFMKNQDEFNSVDELTKYYDSKLLVATTTLGMNHCIFSRRRFDYCIVDESSQIALPICLGPLHKADRFILVGDHYQLPPLFAQSTPTTSLSLFKHLSEMHPIAVTSLHTQYRMNADIMLIANHLIYDYRLRCGSELIEMDKLKTPLFGDWFSRVHEHPNTTCKGQSQCWLSYLLNPMNSVVFCNTDDMDAFETKTGNMIENRVEADLILQTVKSLILSGCNESDIGIASPYRNQLKLMTKLLKSFPNIEILTIDQFQGRDKKCILISMTRNNQHFGIGDLVRDWRRLNVAVTRSKLKLIMFGSKKTLMNTVVFQKLFELMDLKGWGLDLTADAAISHGDGDEFEVGMSLVSSPTARKFTRSDSKRSLESLELF